MNQSNTTPLIKKKKKRRVGTVGGREWGNGTEMRKNRMRKTGRGTKLLHRARLLMGRGGERHQPRDCHVCIVVADED